MKTTLRRPKKKAISTKPKKIRFDVISIFPHIFESYLKESLIWRSQKRGILTIKTHDPRAYTTDKHHKVDDTPFGGGPGMVLQVGPIYRAVQAVRTNRSTRTILFSTRGKKLDSKAAKRLSKYEQLVLICGRYEGVDERVAKYIADEEISIGDYILSGGELPALVLIEAVSRYLPGFLGKYESLEDIKGSYPAYTKPAVFEPQKGKKWLVPAVLLSGNHKKIQEWRTGRGLSALD